MIGRGMAASASSALLFLLLVSGANTFLLDDAYQVWLTTGDQTKNLTQQADVPMTSSGQGYSVWVDRTKRRQTMEGFGAALSNSAAFVLHNSPIRHDIMRDLFGNQGLGISYLRLVMGCSDLQAVSPYTYDDISSGTDFDLHHFSIDKDRAFVLPIVKEALSINPNLKILATPWTAPAWMKTSNNLFGGDMRGGSNYLHTYANYFVRFINAYKAEGVAIESLSIQNEPLISRDDYPTMNMSSDIQKTFIRDHLGPMFRSNGITTKILIFDHNWSGSDYAERVLSDGSIQQYVAGIAWHGYEGRHETPGTFHTRYPNLGMYLTEFSGGSWDTNYANTLTWDTRIMFIGEARYWVKAVMLWNLALDQFHGPKVGVGGCRDCRGVVTIPSNNPTYIKNMEYYALGHMSKFVKPGAVRLETNDFNWDDLRATAFQNTDGSTVIVVENPNSSKSASFSLDIDAKHYQYWNLPPQSVVTFVK